MKPPRYNLQVIINKFEGKYAFLSNFSYHPVFDYPTNEHYFQSVKTIDPLIKEQIKNASTPGKAKRIGRKIPLRPEWKDPEFKICAMYKGLIVKFRNPEIAKQLVETKDAELVEGNMWHDNFWGNCICSRCEDIIGANYLGKLLMKLRQEILIQGAFGKGPLHNKLLEII